MKLDEIEEVIASAPIQLLAGSRTLTLAETFCPPKAVDAVAHELRRLIVEVGSKRSL
jgi:hypothetical protein